MAAIAAVVLRGSLTIRTAALWRCSISIPVSRSRYHTHVSEVLQSHLYMSAPCNITIQQCRRSSFFNRLTAAELWKGVLAESGAGRRKGRGKRTKKKFKRDLNRGQFIGEGRSGILWPGLNAPIMKSGTIQAIGKRDQAQQEEMRAEILRRRDELEKKMKTRVKKERGWSGGCWGGVGIGPPDPGPNGETYEDFDSRIIEVRRVSCMTALTGRTYSVRVLVVVGNGNGAAGFALGKASDRADAFRKAKNRAIHCLQFIERYDDHTIYHDVSSTFKRTTIRMKKQNRGYGLHCHRAIITICKLIGITDMYAKVSGSTNLINITRALFQGLRKQETHQTLADKKGLHVVEFREECGALPLVVASPQGEVRKDPEPEDEVPDTKLEWSDVKAAQGMKRSVWANVKRTIF